MNAPGWDPSLGEEIARKLQWASRSEKAAIVRGYAETLGCGPGKIYRLARRHGFRGFGKERADKGKRKLTDEQIQKAAAVSYGSKRKTERIIMPTWKVKEVLEDSGILQPGQVSGSTINRYFRELGLNQASLLSPAPHQPLASLHPNHVHQLDSSVCIQYDFKEKGKRWSMVDRDMKLAFYKNKPQYFREIKKVLLRYLMTDHASGTIFPFYYYVRGEDTKTLVDFVRWAVENYPADKYALILSDHGMGWPGGWNDPTARGQGRDDVPIARAFGDLLYLMELDRALAQAVRETGIGQFELIGFDACLMAHVEVFAAVQPYARYAVASQEVEPGLGWAYAAFLNELVNNPGMDGAALGRAIVDTYIVADERVVDDEARADYTGRRLSAEAVAQATAASATLSAVDLERLPAVLQALDEFALRLGEADPSLVARARRYAQSFESIFGEAAPPSYIDLAHFAALAAQQTGDAAVTDAAKALLAAMGDAILAETSGPERPGAYGMSIYFPNSDLFRASLSGYASYTSVAQRFADNSLWDDFLVAHYTGRPLTRTVTLPTPAPEAAGVAPGAGTITLDPIELSAGIATADQPVILTTQATGENIGFIYLFVGYYDEARNALKFADQDFIEGDATQAVDGVFYPVWDGPEIPIEFEWTPTLYAIDDGTRQVQALLNPEGYGATAEDATFSTDGRYVFASGEKRYARVIFDGRGDLRAVFGFTGADGTGAPSEITPQAGDRFILLDTWYDLATEAYYTTEGETLTFGATPWTWFAIDAPPGRYNLGFIVEDLDGNYSEAYVDVEVR